MGAPRCRGPARARAGSVSRAAGGPDEGRSVTGCAAPSAYSSVPPPDAQHDGPRRPTRSSGRALTPCGWFFLRRRRAQTHTGTTMRWTREKARLTRGRSSAGPHRRPASSGAGLRRGPFGPEIQAGPARPHSQVRRCSVPWECPRTPPALGSGEGTPYRLPLAAHHAPRACPALPASSCLGPSPTHVALSRWGRPPSKAGPQLS